MENAEAFLQEATSSWEETLPEEGAEISEDASCHYVLGADGSVTGELACGGVRTHAAEEGHVWDLIPYELRENSDGEVHAQLPENWRSEMEFEQTRPGESVVTAEGEEAPESIDELAAPETPQAEAGFSITRADALSELDLTQAEEIESSEVIVTPAGELAIEEIYTLETVPLPGADRESLGEGTEDAADENGESSSALGDLEHEPADGEAFYYVEAEFRPAQFEGPVWQEDEQDAWGEVETEGNLPEEAELLVAAGGEQHELLRLTHDEDNPNAEAGAFSFLVSADAGAADQLLIRSEGEKQSFSLAQGQRNEEGAAAGYYSEGAVKELGHEFPFADQEIEVVDGDRSWDGEVHFDMELMTASLVPYTPEHGWAEEGRVWLQLEFDQLYNSRFIWEEEQVDLTITAVDQDGEAYTREFEEFPPREFAVALDVPAEAHSFTITPALDLEISYHRRDASTHASFTTEGHEVEFPAGGEDQNGGEG